MGSRKALDGLDKEVIYFSEQYRETKETDYIASFFIFSSLSSVEGSLMLRYYVAIQCVGYTISYDEQTPID